eukprot:CAMPEP_0203811570 /NCGR_PEP_ID=MMETSP0115-20131106/3641_1 /ASSEMBLY_ACC=CAM_ASM_000227 /TAXON_ID=33651 /ORGANISM="Bicosoecid sp, Strain ms1" /LENGTH=376 /DNA_ID=CAMNT_0050720395 /DNA_START=162 /DNA_END=1288 /DNA_ORIENTATION=-
MAVTPVIGPVCGGGMMVVSSASAAMVGRDGGGVSRHLLNIAMRTSGTFRLGLPAEAGAGGGGGSRVFRYDSDVASVGGDDNDGGSVRSGASGGGARRGHRRGGRDRDDSDGSDSSDDERGTPTRARGGKAGSRLDLLRLRAPGDRPRSKLMLDGSPQTAPHGRDDAEPSDASISGSTSTSASSASSPAPAPQAPPLSNLDLVGDRVFEAASTGDVGALRRLLAAGSNTGYTNARGLTALHYAAARGKVDAVRALLEAKAPLDAVDRDGRTPLLRAAADGAWEVVVLLCDAGADVNRQTPAGSSALHYWAGGRGRGDAFAALRRAGAWINARNDGQWTPLHLAASRGHTAGVEALVRAGARVDAARGASYLPLHDAA